MLPGDVAVEIETHLAATDSNAGAGSIACVVPEGLGDYLTPQEVG